MPHLIRRGRLIFIVLALFIVVDKLATLVWVLAHPDEFTWRKLLEPLVIAGCVIVLWRGEKWLRWITGIWCAFHGGFNLVLLGFVVYRLALATPPGQVGFFLKVSAIGFGVPLLHAGFYFVAGLLFLVSSSLKAFLENQCQVAKQQELSESHGHDLFQLTDALNAQSGGGTPVSSERHLGDLPVRSGALVLGDPQDMPALEIPNIECESISITARLWVYPTGRETITSLSITVGDGEAETTRRQIGRLGIDSARLVICDQSDFKEHWTDVGPDRIGVISTARGLGLLRKLKRRFKFDAIQINVVRAEVVGPVSQSLEAEIVSYLESIPKYASFPFMHFHVQTTDSFERVNYMNEEWAFLPVGNGESPRMFACGTGRGDGSYRVDGDFAGDRLCNIFIEFVSDDE